MKKKEFRKLKRLELVELIYQLRKDNMEWRKKCRDLERRLHKAERMALANASHTSDERLERIESMLADIQRARQLEIMLERQQAEPLEGMDRPDFDVDLFMLDDPAQEAASAADGSDEPGDAGEPSAEGDESPESIPE